MALIPAVVAAGGPVWASLSLCIFPVIKQTVAQDSVHAEYGKRSQVNIPPSVLFSFSDGHADLQFACAFKSPSVSDRAS